MLASTVEYLLTKHKCVIVPGLGAFLLQEFSAEIRSNGEIIPPGMKVVFNPELQHNDGLIVSYWKRKLSVSDTEAEYRLSRAVTDLFRKIEKQQTVRFGLLGTLSMTSEKVFCFDNSDQSYRTATYIGLQPVRLPLLQREKESISITLTKNEVPCNKSKVDDFVRVQINFRPKHLIRKTISWAAAAALLFCFSSPFGFDDYNSTQKAALGFPHLSQKTSIQQPIDSISMPVQETTAETIQPIERAPATEVSKVFYVIVSSCPSVKSAEEELKAIWEVRYPKAGVLNKNGRGRVYAHVCTNRSEAEKVLNEIRKSEKSDAWLLINRE